MKRSVIFLFLALFITPTFAQNARKWLQLNGPNIGNHNSQLLFGPKGEIISVGTMGYYQTTNDGATWEEHRIIPRINCTSCTINTGLVIASSGEYYFYFGTNRINYDTSCAISNYDRCGLYQSTDNGLTWEFIFKNKNIQSIIESVGHLFVFELADFYDEIGSFYESIDKGKSWLSLSVIWNNGKFYGSIGDYVFFNPYNAAGAKLNIQNGKVSIFPGGFSYVAQVKSNLLMGWSNYDPHVYISSGDSTWIKANPLLGVGGFSIGPGDTIYAFLDSPPDNHPSIFYTLDEGYTWQKYFDISLPPTDFYSYQHLWNVNCINTNKILFETDRGLYLTSNRGNSWKIIGLPYDTVTKVIVSNGRIFTQQNDNYELSYRNGASAYKLTFNTELSLDKGMTWQRTKPTTSSDPTITEGISGIVKISNGPILAVAHDSNEQWNSVWIYDPAAPNQWVKKSEFQDMTDHPLIASDKERIYISKQITSSDPFLYRSDDTAFTWNALPAPNDGEYIYSLDVSSDGTVYYGTWPALFRSDDHGSTWMKLLPTREIVQLSAIKTFGLSGVLLGTSGAGLLKSTDKGISWARIDTNNFDTVTSIGLDSKGSIAAGTNRGLWFFDIDLQKWEKVTLGTRDDLYIGGIDVDSNDDFYIGTYGSSVWRGTTHGGIVQSVRKNSDSFALSLFPNPASGIVTISFPNVEQVNLEIYDMLGRKISSLHTEQGEVNFNTAQLSDGIYSVKLSSAQTSATGKLIVQH